MNEIHKKLIQAIFEKDIATATNLLQKGANINYINNESTPLLIAIKNNYLSIAKFLLENGADPNNQQGYTLPLIEAIDTAVQRTLYNSEIEDYSLDMINLLLKYGADPSLEDDDGDSAYTFSEEYFPNAYMLFKKNIKSRE